MQVDTFDPTAATEEEIESAYKELWNDAMKSAGLGPDESGWDLPKATRDGLMETLRTWWKQWRLGRGNAESVLQTQARVKTRAELFEGRYGVSDKAPARRTAVQPDNGPSDVVAAPRADRPAMARSVGTPERAADYAPRRRADSTAASPADSNGTAADVDAAVRKLFGTSMEDE